MPKLIELACEESDGTLMVLAPGVTGVIEHLFYDNGVLPCVLVPLQEALHLDYEVRLRGLQWEVEGRQKKALAFRDPVLVELWDKNMNPIEFYSGDRIRIVATNVGSRPTPMHVRIDARAIPNQKPGNVTDESESP